MYFSFENRPTAFQCGIMTGLSGRPHLHDQLELVSFQEGASLVTADSQTVLAEAGDIFLAFPNQIHYYHDVQKPLRGHLLIFAGDFVAEFGSILTKQHPLSPVAKGALDDPVIVHALDELTDLSNRQRFTKDPPPNAELLIRGYLLILMSRLMPLLPCTSTTAHDLNTPKAVLSYCTENFTSDISLQTVADALHISRCHISRLFSHKFHVGFNDYINALRIRRACELLKQGELSVTEIAYAVGYNSTRVFNRCFRAIKNCTPGEYREQHS